MEITNQLLSVHMTIKEAEALVEALEAIHDEEKPDALIDLGALLNVALGL